MKNICKSFLLNSSLMIGVLAFPLLGHAQWNLVWADEFNGSIGPDWVFETGTGSGGWGNNELQYYRQQNATIENGALVITARQESFGGMNYTSARMKTQGRKSWKYGRIEARIQMPSFTGSWPAFWMLGDNIGSVGWPACGEIDIMEHVNTETITHGTIHWQDHNNAYANYSGNTGVGVTSYHLYAIEWDASLIKWFVDGTLYHQASIAGGVNGTSEFHNNFFLILNMAIGGNWPGFTVNNGALPARMLVDYVRVYQSGGSPSGVVKLFQHCDYGGYMVNLNAGSYTLSQLQAFGMADNDVSSVQVQSGYQVTLYQNNNFGGASLVRTGNDNCLVNEGFNDNVTSVIVGTATPSWSTQIEAESWATMAGVQTEGCSEGGLNVGWIDANDWIVWNVNVPANGSYLVEYRVASPNSTGNLQLERAGGSPVFGTRSIPNTGGWQNWTTVSHTVNLTAGAQQIAIKALTGGFNLNWLRISNGGGARLAAENPALEKQLSLTLYPNPAANTLMISGLSEAAKASVFELSGTLVLQDINLSADLNELNISTFKPGIYFLKIHGTNKEFKFIKQ